MHADLILSLHVTQGGVYARAAGLGLGMRCCTVGESGQRRRAWVSRVHRVLMRVWEEHAWCRMVPMSHTK